MQQIHILKGTIESIELQNINKARGHYTYNAHLFVVVDNIDPETERSPGALKVRLDYKPRWKTLRALEKAALSSEGPKPQFFPESFRDYTVGEVVELRVRFTSRDLAHLVR